MSGALADMGVVNEIPDEKERGRNQGRDHAGDMAAPIAAPDQVPAGRDENGADEIQRGVDGRQVRDFQGAERPTSNVQRPTLKLRNGRARCAALSPSLN